MHFLVRDAKQPDKLTLNVWLTLLTADISSYQLISIKHSTIFLLFAMLFVVFIVPYMLDVTCVILELHPMIRKRMNKLIWFKHNPVHRLVHINTVN
jgi:hypothetical protein